MIEIKNLSIAFAKGAPVIDDLSLTVPDGQRTVVIGESGSGKSVMLAAILRILPPEALVCGSITLDGTELLTLSEKELCKVRGKRLAYIPQGSSNSLNPLLTVGFQVAEPMIEFGGIKKKEALQRAVEWMGKLLLGDEKKLAASYPHTLSGGMKQRVLIAMGAASGAKILLADEPTKGLDSMRIDAVIQLLDRLDCDCLLCVSHDLRFASSIADNISVMYAAQQVEYCSRDEFFSGPLHPYSQLMVAAMPENGMSAAMGFAPAQGKAGGCRFRDRCPKAFERCENPPPLIDAGGRKVRCHLYAD